MHSDRPHSPPLGTPQQSLAAPTHPIPETLEQAESCLRAGDSEHGPHLLEELLLIVPDCESVATSTVERHCWCGGTLADSVHPLYGRCQVCGTQVLRRNSTEDELKSFYGYQQYWHDHQSKVAGHPSIEQRAENDFKDRIPVWYRVLVANHSAPRRVLEIGCAHGGFLHYCRQHGSDTVVGVEVDEATCKFARDRFGLPHVMSGLFPAVKLPVDQFDVVCGFDVIEHFLDPVEGLRGVAKILAPGGICFFQTPCHRGEGGGWKQFRPQEHIFLYTEASVRRLFEQCGLEVAEIIPGCFPEDMFIVGRRKGEAVKSPAANSASTLRRVKVAADYAEKLDLTQIDGQSEFAAAIRRLFSEHLPKRILETGTYLGEGTTRVIASTLRELGMNDAQFHSIEINPGHLAQARQNLSRDGLARLVQLHHGVSVPRHLLPSLEEIERSTVLEIEENDIFVDHREHERAALYFKETNFHSMPDDLLGQVLRGFNGRPDFVLLDSGGHMGNVEFNYLLGKLEGPCWIALDDVHHIKHRRSLRQMQADSRFEIIVNSMEKFGFCIARFQPAASAVTNSASERRCWCGGSLLPSVHELYGRCAECSTQVLRQLATPSELKAFYTFDHYWHEHQTKDLRCPPIEQRASDDLKDRVPVWHKLLTQLKPGAQTLLEIGCGHGGFLHYCRERGVANVVGVEVDESTCEFARAHFALPHVYSGLFPAVKLPVDNFDAVAGFDVLDHLPNPVAALKEVARLLDDDGVFLFQLPCYRGEGREWRMFCPINHVFLYTENSLRQLFERAGLKVDQIFPGHFPDDVFVVGRKHRDEQRLLWVRLDSIGDAVLASSMLPWIEMKYPGAKIAVLCQQHVADVYLAAPMISSVICVDRKRAEDEAYLKEIIGEIVEFNPDLVLNSTRSRDFLSELLTLAFQDARHIGIESDLSNMDAANRTESMSLYSRIIPSPGQHKLELDRHIDFLAGLDIKGPVLQPRIWTAPEDEALAEAFFKENGLNPETTIALFPGAQHQWRVYGGYGEALGNLSGFDWLLFGTEAEEPLGKAVGKALIGRVYNLCGRSGLRETAALLRRCRLYVGSESAGAHMASAMGVPNVVLLGGGHFGRFMPWSPLTSAVVLPLGCFGCNWACPHARSHCVKDISPSVLTQAVQQTLERSSTRARIFLESSAHWTTVAGQPFWKRPDAFLESVPGGVEIVEVELPQRQDLSGIVQPPKLNAENLDDLPLMSAAPRPVNSASSSSGSVPQYHSPATPVERLHDATILEISESSRHELPPLVTAIVSTYNSERFMRRCLEDLEAQTIARNMEILIIDSGSEQNERSIVEEYQRRYDNIRYVRTERETLYASWNRAVRLARGKYVANANTDDSRRNDALEILSEALEAHPEAHLAYGNYGMTNKPNDTFPSQNVYRDVIHDPYHPAQVLFYCPTGCLQFWRKSALEELNCFNDTYKCVGDYEILIRFMRAGLRAVLVPEFLSLFYINQQGLSFGSGTAAKENQDTKKRYRQEVTADEVFDIDSSNPRELASAWIALGNLAASVRVPWSDTPHRFEDYSISCYNNAMKADPNEPSAWHNVAVIAHRLGIRDLVEKFRKTIPNISSILEGAKRDPRLRGHPVRPRVEGLVYDRRLPSMFAVETQKTSMAAKFSGTKSKALVPLASKAPYHIAWEGSFLGESEQSLPVAWTGSFLDPGSLSHVNREFTRALESLPGIQLQRVTNGAAASPGFESLAGKISKNPPQDTAVTVRHVWPPDWSPVSHGALVVIQPWEYGSLPAEWVAQARHVQQFWVYSEHLRQVYIQSGVPSAKVKVVPIGIDPAKFSPEVQPMDLATRKSFKFLFVGGTIHRKGPDVLLESYLRSFTAQDDVCLVIKDFGGQSFYAGQTIEARIKAAQSLPNAPEILYLNTELPPEALPGLYTACNCLVHPYRGEGFGLPILEAMACGLPVIVTAGGAADDFATAELAYHIPAQRRSIGREISGMPLVGDGWLLEPSVKETAARMRHVFGHREEARAKGQAASQAVRRDWTWDRAGALAHQHLQTLVADIGAAAAKVSPPPTRSKAAPIVLPPCALIGHLAQGRAHLGNKKYRAAWESTLAAIKSRPFHPEAYLLLAQVAQAAGDATSARRCAQHARSLAPEWKPIKRFLKSNLRGNAKHEWLVLPDSLASRSTPHAPRLSVCLIVKDEEKFLGQCLASVRGIANQIIVVDTGSTDRTVAIAKEHGAEVHDFAWCDDFSAARNAALEHATGDWVLMLDADEELPPTSHDALRKLLAVPSVMAWRLPIIDVGRENEGCCYVPRLFRNAPALFYVGRVHEQVFTSIEVRREEWGLDNRLGDAALRHHGYLPEIVKDRNKIERNLLLLEKAIVELPDEPNLLMNYGLELTRSGQRETGIEHYRKAFDLMSAQPPALVIPETREMLLTQFCTQLTALRRFEEIIGVLTSPFAKSGGLTASLHFGLGLAHLELKQSREAADQMRQCLAKRGQPSLAPINPEIRKAGPHHCLALCLAALGETDAAAAEFCLAIEDDPQSRPARFDYARLLAARDQSVEALNLLFELAKQKADDSAVWVLGGQIALSRPEFLEVALDWTSDAGRHLPQDLAILRQRAEVLTLANRSAEALPLWRQLRPESDPALAAALVLCEVAANDDQFSPPLHLEAQISREFLKWYQRLIQFNGRPTIEAVNARMDSLQSRLPSVAHVLREALAQAGVAAAA